MKDEQIEVAIEKLVGEEYDPLSTTATLDNVTIDSDFKIKINALIQSMYLDDEIDWTYDPATDKVSAGQAMNNPLGHLLLTLLLNTKSINQKDFDRVSQKLG